MLDATYSEPILDAAKRLNVSAEAVQTYLDAGRGERADGVSRFAASRMGSE